jgi:hypothetical protein
MVERSIGLVMTGGQVMISRERDATYPHSN